MLGKTSYSNASRSTIAATPLRRPHGGRTITSRLLGTTLVAGVLVATMAAPAHAAPQVRRTAAITLASTFGGARSTPRLLDSRPTMVSLLDEVAALRTRSNPATDTVDTPPPPVPAIEVAPQPAPTPEPAPEPPAPTPGEIAAFAAISRIGAPYVWAASGPNSFDCSGLTMWAFNQVGIGLGHYTGSQYAQTTRISEDELVPGDLVFYFSGGGDPSHVGIYVGDGNMVHAPGRGRHVKFENIHYWSGARLGFGRVQ